MTTSVAVPLWRNRDFTLLWTSQVASTVGTRITAVAYPLLVLLLTGSPALAGVVAFAQTLPFLLLYLPAGAWIDRWDRRRTMVVCELGRAVALGSVAAVALIRGSAFLRDAVALVAGMNLVFNGLFLALVVRAHDLGASPEQVGLMLGIFGLGGVLGSIAAPWLHRRLPGRLILVGTAWAWAGLLLLQPLAPTWLLLGVVAGVGALFGPPFNVVIAAYVYRVTPDELMGRVRSAIRLVAWGTIPVGSLLGGVLSEALGPGPALLVFALGMLPVAVATTLSRGMREISAAEPRPAPET